MTHPLEVHWQQLSKPVQKALSLAFNHSRQEGRKGRLRTRYVVAALRTLHHDSLSPLLAEISDTALPDPLPVDRPVEIKPLHEEKPELSPCVRESLTALGAASSGTRRITPVDLFVDLSRHGAGSTVSMLRSQGYTRDKIDQLLNEQYPSDPLNVTRSNGRT